MQKGRVKWFNDKKGYGFITPDAGGPDVFVHYTDIDGSGHRALREGESVEFESERSQRGMKATKVVARR